MVKNLPADAGDAREVGSIPGWERSPGGGNGNPFQYSCLENPMDRGACGAWWGLQAMRSHRIRHSWAPSGWHWELHFPSHPICSSPRWVPSTSVPACIWPAKAWLNLQIKKQMNLDAESLREDGKRGLWGVDSWVSLGLRVPVEMLKADWDNWLFVLLPLGKRAQSPVRMLSQGLNRKPQDVCR